MAKAKNDALRLDILKAAYRLFCEKGYGEVQMREIAAAVDISPQLLQHYYPKRDDLLVAIVYNMILRTIVYLGERESLIDEVAEKDAHYVWIGLYYRLFYSVLTSGDRRLFEIYYEVLLETMLSLRVHENLSEAVRSLGNRRFYGGPEWELGKYVLCGSQAHMVVYLYQGSSLTRIPEQSLREVLDKALCVYYGYRGLAQPAQQQILETLDAIATEQVLEDFRRYFFESKEEFSLVE